MSWTRVQHWIARIEVQTAGTLLFLAAPVLASALVLSLGYAAHEMLEQRGAELAALGDALAQDIGNTKALQLEGPLYDLIEREQIAIRILDGDRIVAARGLAGWFSGEALDPKEFWNAIRAEDEDFLSLTRFASGLRIEMAASLAQYIEERGELIAGFWLSLAVGLVGCSLFSIVATLRALRPLREATQAISLVNADQLSTRLPLRHTGDVVDRHAEALNQAMDRLEVGFSRTRAFSADVAHELRTPINRLLNQAGAQLLSNQHEEGAAETWLSVQGSAEEMQAIVEGLLLLSQADEGRLRLQMHEISLRSLLEGLQALYEPVCEEHGVRLEVKTEDSMIVGDESLILRALSNLIDNAIGHTPDGGCITIDTSSDPDILSIFVCDTGDGVSPEDLDRIFDRFVRIDPTGPRRGSGLGLPISRAIAIAHGGMLSARAAASGGTCFELSLSLR